MLRSSVFFSMAALFLALAPAQGDADVARQAVRPIDDLDPESIAARLKVLLPELDQLARQAGEGLLPAMLLLIDGAAAIRGQGVRKAADLDLGAAVVHGALDDRGGALHPFLVGDAGRLLEALEELLFLGL